MLAAPMSCSAAEVATAAVATGATAAAEASAMVAAIHQEKHQPQAMVRLQGKEMLQARVKPQEMDPVEAVEGMAAVTVTHRRSRSRMH